MGEFLRSHNWWLRVASVLFAVLIVGPLGNRIWDWSNVWPWTTLMLILTLLLAWWRWIETRARSRMAQNVQELQEHQQRQQAFREQFALCKPVRDLRPSDFRFQYLDPGERADQDHRPFYHRYVPRRIVPLDVAAGLRSEITYTEAALTDELTSGHHVVILGEPTMGKTRTLYQVVSHLRDWLIVSPWTKGPIPADEVFKALIANQPVVLVLDDLNDFAAGSAPDLVAFREAMRRANPSQCVVAATCRDGPELSVVNEAIDSSLRRFYDDLPLRVVLLPQTEDEKAEVAASAGKIDWDPTVADLYPTPGAIVMEEALRYQRTRFVNLSGVQQDTLRSLQLLTAAGVLPLTHTRLSAVLTHVFQPTPTHLGEVLDRLTNQSFLRRPARQDPVAPEPAYIAESVVPYIEGRRHIDDFPLLKEALRATQDAKGLFLLSLTLAADYDDHSEALSALETALEHHPDDHDTLLAKGIALGNLGRHEEALEVYDTSLKHRPDNPSTLRAKGVALDNLGQHEEALEVYDASLKHRPDDPGTLLAMSVALSRLGRHEEELAALEAALKHRPNNPGALRAKGVALSRLGRHEEELAALEAALKHRPNDPGALRAKGVALSRLGRHEEALEVYDTSLKHRPDNPSTLRAKGVALSRLGRHEEALEMYDTSLKHRPNDPGALRAKGVALSRLGRHEEALPAFEAALDHRPDDPGTLRAMGVALSRLGRHEEALRTCDLYLRLHPDGPHALLMRSIRDDIQGVSNPEDVR